MATSITRVCASSGTSLFSHYFQCRLLSVTACTLKKIDHLHSVHRKAEKYLSRKLNETATSKRKRPWYDSPQELGDGSLWKPGKPSAGKQRRAKQLSVVLYEYISSMINSGEMDPRLVDLGIDVIQVKMAPDMSNVTVYWSATGSEKDAQIEAILSDVAHRLRSHLVSLRIMGDLPPIQFLKDTSAARISEVERLLAIADFGPDHVPSPLGHELVSPVSLQYDTKTFQDKINHLSHVFQDKDIEDQIHSQSDHQNNNLSSLKPSQPDMSRAEITKTTTFYSASDNLDEKSEKYRGGSSEHLVEEVDNDLIVPLRSDLYSVDHNNLLKKLEIIKNRKGRSIPGPVTEVVSGMQDVGTGHTNFKKQNIKRSVSKVSRSQLTSAVETYPADLQQGGSYSVELEEEEDFIDERDLHGRYQ